MFNCSSNNSNNNNNNLRIMNNSNYHQQQPIKILKRPPSDKQLNGGPTPAPVKYAFN